MKYQIVTDYDPETLAQMVEELLEEGWTLQGGVSLGINGASNNQYFAQALVKKGV